MTLPDIYLPKTAIWLCTHVPEDLFCIPTQMVSAEKFDHYQVKHVIKDKHWANQALLWNYMKQSKLPQKSEIYYLIFTPLWTPDKLFMQSIIYCSHNGRLNCPKLNSTYKTCGCLYSLNSEYELFQMLC